MNSEIDSEIYDNIEQNEIMQDLIKLEGKVTKTELTKIQFVPRQNSLQFTRIFTRLFENGH